MPWLPSQIPPEAKVTLIQVASVLFARPPRSQSMPAHLQCLILVSRYQIQLRAHLLKITLLEAANSPEEAKILEVQWTRRLFAFKPTGLNMREEVD